MDVVVGLEFCTFQVQLQGFIAPKMGSLGQVEKRISAQIMIRGPTPVVDRLGRLYR